MTSEVVASVVLYNYEVEVVYDAGQYQLRRTINDNDDLSTRYASLGDALRALSNVVDSD